MEREDIIQMARQAASHGVENHKSGEVTFVFYNEHLMNFAQLVHQRGYTDGWSDADKAQKETALFYKQEGAEEEREACAVDAEWCIQNFIEQYIPERIRARGNT